MRALVITEHGGPEVLKVEERPDAPPPGPGEVRVAVKAAGINFADLMARVGLYEEAPKPPSVVGYEFAGDVESVGEGVTEYAAGQRVLGGSRFGAYAELVTVPENGLVPLPDDWSYEEGAAFTVHYVTAYAGIVRYGSLLPGEDVLLHAAAGGVGIASTQIARLCGAGTIYGTASGSKHEAIRGFGVDHPIDYTKQDFRKEVRRISGDKQPLDLVMDAVGGSSFRKSWSLLGAGGRLVCFGASSVMSGEKRDLRTIARMLATTPVFHPMPMMSSSRAVIGLNMLRLWDAKGSLEEYVQPLRTWVDEGKLRPVVSEAFPLERGPDAHRYMGERRNIGKVVLTV
jgi:NADPH:quinone reductase-like Zn-dependent oxidoreductase